MTPEILIVGDASRRRGLIREVRDTGYEVTLCEDQELNRRIRTGAPPASIIICLEDADAGVLLATLRRSRRGAAIPVVLFGQLGGEIRDLADVLDLGADHFVRDPYDDRELREALRELAGPPVDDGADRPAPVEREREFLANTRTHRTSSATQRIHDRRGRESESAGREDGMAQERSGARDPVLGQLTATLDRLEARLRERDRNRDRERQGSREHAEGWSSPGDASSSRSGTASSASGPEHARAAFGEGRRHADRVSAEAETSPAVRAADLVRARLDAPSSPTTSSAAPRGDGPVDLEGLDFDGIPEVEADAGTLDPAELTHGGADGVAGTAGAVGAVGAADPDADTFDDGGPAGIDRERTATGRVLDPFHEDSDPNHDLPTRTRTESTVRLDDSRTSRGRATEADPPAREPEERSAELLAPRRPPRRGRGTDPRGGGLPRSGSLVEVDVPSLLWQLHEERVTGRLRLTRGRVEKQLWLARGEVSFARSGSSADRFVDSLLRRGVLTRAQYETASRLAAREPRRAGELLIEAGLIKEDELAPLLGDHLSHMIQSTFPWHEGVWTFEPGASIDEPITLEVDLGSLILDGIRGRVETSRLREMLGSELSAPRLGVGTAIDALARRYDLVPEELSWLERFDGHTPLRSFLDEPGTDEHGLLALTTALQITGELRLEGEVGRRVRRDPTEIDKDRVVERLRIAREADYFELLGLPRDATRTEVRRAHAQVADTFADRALESATVESLGNELAELRAALLEARDILMDDALRSAYLAHLDEGVPLADGRRPR